MVVEGLLKSVSGGSVISGAPRRVVYTENMGIGRVHEQGKDLQRGMINRQIVEIGDTRLVNVVLPSLADAILLEAMGEHIAVGVNGPDRAKRLTVVSIKTPRHGLYKPPLLRILAAMVFAFFWMLVLALVGGVFIGALLGALVSPVLGILAGLAFASWILIPSLRLWVSGLRARSALG